MELNPGIVRTVKLLNDHGFTTCDSGDGETRDYECDRDRGYVVVRTDDVEGLGKDCHLIAMLLEAAGVNFVAEGTLISGSYSPFDQITIIDVDGIHDRMLVNLGLDSIDQ